MASVTPDQRVYWATHPVEWCSHFLNVKLWSKQEEIATSILKYDAVTVRSGHGVGKSFIAAAITLWWLFTHPGSRVISTAPSFDQVRNILWVEIAKLHLELSKRAWPVGHLTTTRLELAPGWFAMGRSTDEPNKLIGAHERNLLVIFDEACGISRILFDAAEGLLTAKGNKRLLIGNPTVPGTYFHDTHTGNITGYHTIRINVLDSPNIRQTLKKGKIHYEDNLDENGELPFPDLTAMKWVEKMRKDHGEKSNEWISKVLGEFPTLAADSLYDGRHISAAVQKGAFLREIVKNLDEGQEIMDSAMIRRVMGRNE